jgi:hypothetical protein
MSTPNIVRRRIKPRIKENEDTEDAEIELTEVIHRVTLQELRDLAQPKVYRTLMMIYC